MRKDYTVSHTILSSLEVIGWLSLIYSVYLAYVGYRDAVWPMFDFQFAMRNPTLEDRLFGASFGIFLAIASLIDIAFVKVGQACVDIAQSNQDIAYRILRPRGAHAKSEPVIHQK